MRLDLSRGAIVSVDDRLFKITDDSIAFNQIEARDIETGRIERLAVSSLRVPEDLKVQDAPALSTIDPEDLEEARRRLNVIGPLLQLPRRSLDDIRAAAAALGVSKNTIYRLLNRFATDGRLTSLRPLKPPGGRGRSRLDPDIERIIKAVIDDYHLKSIQPTADLTAREVQRRCRNANVVPPHRNTIRVRLQAIPESLSMKRRGHSKQAKDRFTARPGHFEEATHPLSLVQIDHTPLDVVLVDERFRLPLHRPYLTLVFDVFSRMIMSFYISFERPGALATGLAIARAILPKDDWLLKHDIAEEWPCWGFPTRIHCDNAKEFRGEMVRLACEQHGIGIEFRPVAEPAMGGHIERVLGTVMRQSVHDLAGAARKPAIRDEYDSEASAIMTLPEFEERLTRYITGIYHQQYHAGIKTTPLRKWTDAILGDGEHAGIGLFPRPQDEDRLRIDFMPVEKRTISREGVRIDNIFYFHDALRPYVSLSKGGSKQYIFHRDPRDISVIFFWDPDAKQYLTVPYRDATHPPISVWELNAVKTHLESQGRAAVNEELIFKTYDWLRNHEARSRQETREVRRRNERRAALDREPVPRVKKAIVEPTAPAAAVTAEGFTSQPKRFAAIEPLESEEET